MSLILLQQKMDGMTRRQKIELILMMLSHEAKRNSPDEFRAFVIGALGNFVESMSDASFEEFCSVHHCDDVACDCHVIAEEAAKFFKLLRADIKKEFLRRNARRN